MPFAVKEKKKIKMLYNNYKEKKKGEIHMYEVLNDEEKRMIQDNTEGQIFQYMEVKKYCIEKGYKCCYQHGFVNIKTRYEKWKFRLTEGKVTLYHYNNVSRRKSKEYADYHKQMHRWITMQELVTYINEHERAKYMGEKIRFSVSCED